MSQIGSVNRETIKSMPEKAGGSSSFNSLRGMDKSHDATPAKPENRTGLPDALKTGVEGLSGLSLDEVRVHYNSDKPARVGAAAYTQGRDIHVATGQERHLPHEAWHVVQQAQGRVNPTLQMRGFQVNDDVGLEREADVMGRESLIQRTAGRFFQNRQNNMGRNVIQCAPIRFVSKTGAPIDLEPDEIVQKLHQFMINTQQQGWPMPATPDPREVFPAQEQLNFQESLPSGPPRAAENIKDYYKLVKEAKITPAAFFSLSHGAGVESSQFIPNVTEVNGREDMRLVDGFEKVFDNKGAYKEFLGKINQIKEHTGKNDQEIARQYLDLLAGRPLAAEFDVGPIKSVMHSHISIMILAESRRDAGMFSFTPISFQNVADGKSTFAKLFSVDKAEQEAFPAAFEGSKGPLIAMEALVKANLPLTYNRHNIDTQIHAQTQNAAVKKADFDLVFNRMKAQISFFFKNGAVPDPARTNFSSAALQDLPGAEFNDKAGALEAIVNLLKRDYFSSIPAMFEGAPPPPAQATEPVWSTPAAWAGNDDFPTGHPYALPDEPAGRHRTPQDHREMTRNRRDVMAISAARRAMVRRRQATTPESDMQEQVVEQMGMIVSEAEPFSADRPDSPRRSVKRAREEMMERSDRIRQARGASDPERDRGYKDAMEGKPATPGGGLHDWYDYGYKQGVQKQEEAGFEAGVYGQEMQAPATEYYRVKYVEGQNLRQLIIGKAEEDAKMSLPPDPETAVRGKVDIETLSKGMLLSLSTLYARAYLGALKKE